MKIDRPAAIDLNEATALSEFDIDRVDIGLGSTYGVLRRGFSVAETAIGKYESPTRSALNPLFGRGYDSSLVTSMSEFDIDRVDIGLGSTYGVLRRGFTATMPAVSALANGDTNKLPRAAPMISAMLL